jgi:hypothetical protein
MLRTGVGGYGDCLLNQSRVGDLDGNVLSCITLSVTSPDSVCLHMNLPTPVWSGGARHAQLNAYSDSRYEKMLETYQEHYCKAQNCVNPVHEMRTVFTLTFWF